MQHFSGKQTPKAQPQFMYVEVVRRGTEQIIRRIDVTGKTERQINQVVIGANIYLPPEFGTRIQGYDEPQPCGKFPGY